MFVPKILIEQGANPTVAKIIDASLTNETIVSRKIVLTDSAGNIKEVNFEPDTQEIILQGLTKDIAFIIDYKATVANPIPTSDYETNLHFAFTGHADNLFRKRVEYYQGNNVYNKNRFYEESNEIIFFINVAQNAIKFCDIYSAQKALDYIRELALIKPN